MDFFFLSETLFCLHNSFFCFRLWWDARRLQIQPPLVLKDELTSGHALVIEWSGTDVQILIWSREAMQASVFTLGHVGTPAATEEAPTNLQAEEGPEARPP